jgi:hypothetical protein
MQNLIKAVVSDEFAVEVEIIFKLPGPDSMFRNQNMKLIQKNELFGIVPPHPPPINRD